MADAAAEAVAQGQAAMAVETANFECGEEPWDDLVPQAAFFYPWESAFSARFT